MEKPLFERGLFVLISVTFEDVRVFLRQVFKPFRSVLYRR